jgi:hypothetical protein
MKATFHCSTLEQAHTAIRFAHKDGLYVDAEVFVDLAGEPVEVKWGPASAKPPMGSGLQNDTVDDAETQPAGEAGSSHEPISTTFARTCDDMVDALLPKSFFGAMGTKYVNDANKGKRLVYRRSVIGCPQVGGRLVRVESGYECLRAVVETADGCCFLPLDKFDFVFLE